MYGGNYIKFIIFMLTALLWAGCTQKQQGQDEFRPERDITVIEGVPFVKQKDNFCGPASMASVIQFYGDDVSQEEVSEEIYIPKLEGALISDMENYARDRGYKVKAVNGSIEGIKSAIDSGKPVIMLVDRGMWKVSVPHYYVAYGYSENGETVILHTGDEGGREMGFDKLDRQWEKMNRLMLVISK
ncbi:MAG: C39 family peptidase [Deltaproteobacteria bacterium]